MVAAPRHFLPIPKWQTSVGYSCVEYLHWLGSITYSPVGSGPTAYWHELVEGAVLGSFSTDTDMGGMRSGFPDVSRDDFHTSDLRETGFFEVTDALATGLGIVYSKFRVRGRRGLIDLSDGGES